MDAGYTATDSATTGVAIWELISCGGQAATIAALEKLPAEAMVQANQLALPAYSPWALDTAGAEPVAVRAGIENSNANFGTATISVHVWWVQYQDGVALAP